MPMTEDQRTIAFADLESNMSSLFCTKLHEQDLAAVRNTAAKIAAQHHKDHDYKSIVVHVDTVAHRSDPSLILLKNNVASRITVTIKDDEDNVIKSFGEKSSHLADAIVYALKALRVSARIKTTRLVGCPICEHYHPTDFNGDCRDDGNRFPMPNDPEDIATHFDNGDPGMDCLNDDDD